MKRYLIRLIKSIVEDNSGGLKFIDLLLDITIIIKKDKKEIEVSKLADLIENLIRNNKIKNIHILDYEWNVFQEYGKMFIYYKREK